MSTDDLRARTQANIERLGIPIGFGVTEHQGPENRDRQMTLTHAERIVQRYEQAGYDAGFAAALSEHELFGWWGELEQKFIRHLPDELDPEMMLANGWEPLYRRSVQSSEVPRTPEEPT